jgi:hypothetical protein
VLGARAKLPSARHQPALTSPPNEGEREALREIASAIDPIAVS